MTLLQKIQNLSWWNEINKLKEILKGLNTKIEVIEASSEGGQTDSRPYKVYTAILTQSGTSAPEAVILENTLGVTPIWNYMNVGHYRCNGNGMLASNKVAVFFDGGTYEGLPSTVHYQPEILNSGDLRVFTKDINGVASNDILSTVIEIRVYN